MKQSILLAILLIIALSGCAAQSSQETIKKDTSNQQDRFITLQTSQEGVTEVKPKTLEEGLCLNDYFLTTFEQQDDNIIRLTHISKDAFDNSVKAEGNSALQRISDLKCLESLKLDRLPITDISALESLPNLKKLYLPSLEPEYVQTLAKLKQLQELEFSFGHEPEKEVCEDLLHALPELDVFDCEILVDK